MSIKILWFLLCVVLSGVACKQPALTPGSGEEPVTATPSGSIRGSWMETRGGKRIEAYRAIRYAEPPVGTLRFQPPKPILTYTSEVDAREEGPACPQPTTPGYYVDEDCLRLNVYTPVKRARKHPLPVIVYMHPGGFYSFSGRSDVSGPRYLMERDIVYVAINYRLASLGFLSTGDKLAPGNNGFKDQVMALRWVKKNIRAFGGDPNMVTVAGYSAGAFSIGLHMVSPMSRGLFHRAISMSASPVSQVVIGRDQRYLAVRQARIFGCPVNTSQEILDCLRSKTAKELGDSLDNMFELKSYDPTLVWNVVVEPEFGQERFLTEQPLDVIREGRMYSVPYIISQTEDEFFWKAFTIQNNQTYVRMFNEDWDHVAPIAFMLPERNSRAIAERLREFYLHDQPITNDTNGNRPNALGRLYSDAVIGFAVHRMANLMCRHSLHKVFHYEFAYTGNQSFYVDPTTGKPTGAAHHDELIYLLSIPARFTTIPLGSEDNTIVEKLTAIWYNFARYGDPNPRCDTPELEGLSWPPMTPNERKYLRIDKQFSVHKDLFKERYKLWDELYPIQY